MLSCLLLFFFFFFNDTATTEIYTLSLHDALPIYCREQPVARFTGGTRHIKTFRSEEHTSELQSLAYLVCRLLLEKKKKKITNWKPVVLLKTQLTLMTYRIQKVYLPIILIQM